MQVASVLELTKGSEPYPGYRLVTFLGKGGWGEVWKTVRSADGKALAIKFLASESQAAAAQEIRALQAIRQVKHPNLLQMEQVWSCPGFVAIVMELAEGSLLDLLYVYQDELKGGILPQHLCFFLSQAATALDYLNTRQHTVNGQRVAFRHCDVKPSNLLVLGRTVKVSDFGLAVQTTSPFINHRRAGTLNYAAPEVFRGTLSERTDQYSLAATYFHLRTGQLPFKDEAQSFSGNYLRPPPDLSPLPVGERTVIARALEPVPQNRWSSCSEMMEKLTACVIPAAAAG